MIKGTITSGAPSSVQFISSTGKIYLHLLNSATWGGTTVKLNLLIDGAAEALQDVSFTAGPVSKVIDVPRGIPCQLTLTGGTLPSIPFLIEQNQ